MGLLLDCTIHFLLGILFTAIAIRTGTHRRRAYHKNMRAIDAAFVLEELRRRSLWAVEPVSGGD